MTRESILSEVTAERQRQDGLWGGAAHDDSHDLADWLVILARHVGLGGWDGSPEDACHKTEATGKYDPARYRKQLVRVAAVAVAALESFDRRLTRDRWQRYADSAGAVLLVCDRDDPATRISRQAEDCIAYAVREEDASEWQRKNCVMRVEPSPNGVAHG